MGFELERRFVVVNESWRTLVEQSEAFQQGYLNVTVDGFVVRVRISDKQKAWITIKAPVEAIKSYEFEYKIPLSDAESLYGLCQHKINKSRYFLNYKDANWVVDCFEGENFPLVLAEVELEEATQVVQVPDWCGKEVTGQFQWSNAALAQKPFSKWMQEST